MKNIHRPIERIVPGARTAVLFVHGLLGTPRFWQPFLAQVPEAVSCVAMTLPGHGGTVPEFGKVPRGAWREAVDRAIAGLCATHERVYIVAHSLGTLLTINSLTDHPRQVAGMLLIAVPLRLWVQPRAIAANILKGLGLGESPEVLATYYGTEQDARPWRYVCWLPRYAELFAESAAARRNIGRLTIPTEAFMFRRDELVSMRSAALLEANPAVHLTNLTASGHHAFAPEEQVRMLEAFGRMLAE